MRIESIFKNAGRVGVICGALVCSAFAKDLCSNETFKGSYGFTVSGVVLVQLPTFTSPGVQWPIQGVQLIQSDGNGNLVDTESLMVNGAPLAGANGQPDGQPPGYFSVHTGTYTLDSNCTGVAFITNGFNFVYVAMVVDKEGSEIRMSVVPPFDSGGIPRVVTSLGVRVEEHER
jgi:hypothetical protein